MHAVTHQTTSQTALRLTADEAYWANFAEAAGWYRCVDGLWLRPARLHEDPHFGDEGGADISAPTAYAACQLDRLGPQAEQSAKDAAAQLTVEGLADAMRANRHNCTKDVLTALGFPITFQEANQDAAVKLANSESVTHLANHPAVATEDMIVAGMREVIGGIMPTLANCIAILRHQKATDGSRLYSDKQINRYMRRVVHLASKDFVSILPVVN